MKTIAFFGGSNLIGTGYVDGIDSKDIYPNIVARQGYNIKNYGIGGASSYEIFLTCMQQLAQKTPPDIVFVEWNMLARYRFYPSPEVMVHIAAAGITMPNSWSHCVSIPKKEIENFQKILLLLDSEYHRLVTLLTYCEIIQNICKVKNIELIMISGNVHWTKDLFESYIDKADLSSCLSDYSKELLDFNNRNDVEILSLLAKLKTQFDLLDLQKWIWVFENIPMMEIDKAPLDNHPGPKTMNIIASRIISFLKEKNL